MEKHKGCLEINGQVEALIGVRSIVQPCPSLRSLTDCSPLGSSIHGIFQARILEGIPFVPPGLTGESWEITGELSQGKTGQNEDCEKGLDLSAGQILTSYMTLITVIYYL